MMQPNRIQLMFQAAAFSAALTFFIGCGGKSGGGGGETPNIKHKFNPHNSPITIADGSMVVRTNASESVSNGELNITGGQACSISYFAGGTQIISVKGANWNIVSYDQLANVSTTDNGATVTADGPNALKIDSDATEGQGYEFGVEAVQFSPATLSINGSPGRSLDCGRRFCKVIINYLIGGTCP